MALFKKRKKEIGSDLLILYGTKSGNSKMVAQQTQKYCEKNGLKAICKNISGFLPEKLSDINKLLFIVSTHGEGEPPPTAKKFFDLCLDENMIALNHLDYSICALGDSSYNEFCWAGKTIDDRFKQLGAKQMLPRVDCDLNFSDDAITWIKETTSVVLGQSPNLETENKEESITIPDEKEYEATIIDRQRLTSQHSKNGTYHISLDISNSCLNYDIGDTVDFLPKNPQWLIEAVSNILALKDESQLNNKELNFISLKTVREYARISESEALNSLVESPEELECFVKKANVLDLLNIYPSQFSAEAFLSILPEIKRRKYSIASSQKLHKNELHLTIKTVRYEYNDTNHEGAASVYTNEILPLNSALKFTLAHNNSFKLPKDTSIPIIMIGVSTGIAPFRAILQEREALNLKGNTWLIWGNKHKADDFLYKSDLEEFNKSGVLGKMDFAFSCDTTPKIYVQDIIKSNTDTLLEWLRKGAHVYVCGSTNMGRTVKDTINNILNFSDSQTTIDESRYHEDTY